jgi:hypothetical protein
MYSCVYRCRHITPAMSAGKALSASQRVPGFAVSCVLSSCRCWNWMLLLWDEESASSAAL